MKGVQLTEGSYLVRCVSQHDGGADILAQARHCFIEAGSGQVSMGLDVVSIRNGILEWRG